MKKLTVLFVMALGIFASCVPYPEEDPDPIPPVDSMFIKKTIQNNLDGSNLITVFNYSDRKIVRIEDTSLKVTDFTYNDLDLIETSKEYLAGVLKKTNTYVYDISENLISLTTIDEATSTGTKWIYVHNSNGTISYQKFSGDNVDQDNLVSTGLISETKRTEVITDPITAEETTDTITYDYDLANNPMMNITGYEKIYFADSESSLNFENNVTSMTTQTNDEAAVVEFTNLYEYTNNNFPSKMNIKEEGILVSTVSFYY